MSSPDPQRRNEAPPVPVHLGDLRGPEGNAYVILGQVRRSFVILNRLDEWPKFHDEATASDYATLLRTVERWCEDLDGSIAAFRSENAYEDPWGAGAPAPGVGAGPPACRPSGRCGSPGRGST
jgi:hypothetical protein